MALFLKECRNILKSYIYYIFIVVVILFYASQMGIASAEDLGILFAPPEYTDTCKTGAPFGRRRSEPSLDMIPAAAKRLLTEHRTNSFATFPLGFYRAVKLDTDENAEIAKVFRKITGKTVEELISLRSADDFDALPVNETLDLNQFLILMDTVDTIIGGASTYGAERIERFTIVPITYEEAILAYKYIVSEDKFTNAYARLSADYLGIVMCIFPVFVAVLMSLKDKKTKMLELVFSRKTSSLKLIFTRYFSLVFMMILPVLLLSFRETITFISFANIENVNIDLFAFFKYTIWWILPTLMLVTAIGVFITTVTGRAIAIAIVLFLWFLNISTIDLSGEYPILGFLIRHNTMRDGALITENFNSIMMNRLLIAGLAILLVIATVAIYEQKRSGKFGFNRKTRKLF
ncbi:MAG: ABC transporter permease [Clostridiales bacterium]|nr:ABC transporter permease [Clostridiales bacterium]